MTAAATPAVSRHGLPRSSGLPRRKARIRNRRPGLSSPSAARCLRRRPAARESGLSRPAILPLDGPPAGSSDPRAAWEAPRSLPPSGSAGEEETWLPPGTMHARTSAPPPVGAGNPASLPPPHLSGSSDPRSHAEACWVRVHFPYT